MFKSLEQKQAERQEWWSLLDDSDRERLKGKLTVCCRDYAGSLEVEGLFTVRCATCSRVLRTYRRDRPVEEDGKSASLGKERFSFSPTVM